MHLLTLVLEMNWKDIPERRECSSRCHASGVCRGKSISVMANDVELWRFVYLFAIRISSLVKCLLAFCPFSNFWIFHLIVEFWETFMYSRHRQPLIHHVHFWKRKLRVREVNQLSPSFSSWERKGPSLCLLSLHAVLSPHLAFTSLWLSDLPSI